MACPAYAPTVFPLRPAPVHRRLSELKVEGPFKAGDHELFWADEYAVHPLEAGAEGGVPGSPKSGPGAGYILCHDAYAAAML